MQLTNEIVIAVILVSIALASLVIFAPGITAGRTGKIVAFMAIFILPVLSTKVGYSKHLEIAESTSFCLKCHVMEDFGKSLHVDDSSHLPAAHYQYGRVPPEKACYTCHSDYTMFGGIRSKMHGLRHVWIYYLGDVPKPEDIKIYNGPYDSRNCLHCHLGSRSFEEGATHNLEPEQMAAIKSAKLTCLSTGCHDVAHNVKDVSTWKYRLQTKNSLDLDKKMNGIKKKLRIAGTLVVLGLLVELISLSWDSPLSFMLFLSVGVGLMALGILFFFWSLVSAPEAKIGQATDSE